jgi:hypothetical protein
MTCYVLEPILWMFFLVDAEPKHVFWLDDQNLLVDTKSFAYERDLQM